jgi:putative FmdB family regulatory protein
MPVYRFRCDCGSEFDALVAMSASQQRCENCGGIALRQFSPTRYLFLPYAHSDDKDYFAKRVILHGNTPQGRKVAEIADRLNRMPKLEDVA